MTHIEDFPLPATSRHDENGAHVPPHISAWRRSPGAHTVKGSEVYRDQQRRAMFATHLEEHRRRGESATVNEEI